MPLYEYECDSCGHRFEVIQRFSDAAIKVCPKCNAQVHKRPSAPAIQFKGAGWYVTDYAKKSGGDSDKLGSDSSKQSDNVSKTTTASSESKGTTEKRSPSTERPSASSIGSSSGSSDKQS